MKGVLTLGMLFILTFCARQETEDCCREKSVEDDLYIYLERDDTISQYNCMSSCVYRKEGDPDPEGRYCFKPGHLQVSCKSDAIGK